MLLPAGAELDDVQAQVIAAILAQTFEWVGDRVYPNVLPQDVAHIECVRVSLISSQAGRVLSGQSGDATSTVQVDVFGDIKANVNWLGKVIKGTLLNSPIGTLYVFSVTKINEFDEQDAPLDGSDRFRFRRLLRFDIVHAECYS